MAEMCDGSITTPTVIYILLCGFPPIVRSNSQEELFVDILSSEYGFPSPYWDDVSSSAKNLISNNINKKTKTEYTSFIKPA